MSELSGFCCADSLYGGRRYGWSRFGQVVTGTRYIDVDPHGKKVKKRGSKAVSHGTTTKEAEEQKQHTQPVTVILNKKSNTNTNKKKKKKRQKKATLKITHMPAIIEEEEEVPTPSGMFYIDNEFTTGNTKEEKETPKTLNSQEKTEKLTRLITVANLNVDIVEYSFGMLSEDLFDEWDTRERVCGILMEELTSQSDVDGVSLCDRLLYLLDGIDTTTGDPMANPPTNTKV